MKIANLRVMPLLKRRGRFLFQDGTRETLVFLLSHSFYSNLNDKL